MVRSEEIYVGVFRSMADARLDTSWTPPPIGLRMFVAAAQQPTVENVGGAEVRLRPGFAVDLHEVIVRR